jgi:hypothetical protein
MVNVKSFVLTETVYSCDDVCPKDTVVLADVPDCDPGDRNDPTWFVDIRWAVNGITHTIRQVAVRKLRDVPPRRFPLTQCDW